MSAASEAADAKQFITIQADTQTTELRAITTQAAIAEPQRSTTQTDRQPAVSALSAMLALAAPPPSAPLASSHRRRPVWLALHLFDWPLQAALRMLPAAERESLRQRPVIVVAADRQRRVLHGNDAALRQGIRPGHTLNAAIALCHHVHALPRQPEQERALSMKLAEWAQQYTSCVSIESGDELLLDVRGSLKLFGGSAALLERIAEELQRRGISAGVSLSVTARSALWLARLQSGSVSVRPNELRSRLGELPLRCLHWPMEIELQLLRFGVRKVGDLLRLPRGDLGRRIGKAWLRELDSAMGRHPEPRRCFIPAPSYTDRLLLDFEIETVAMLTVLLGPLLNKLGMHLRTHDLALTTVHIALKHRDMPLTPLRISLAMPTADIAHIHTVLREHLSTLVLPAPVLQLDLCVRKLMPARGQSLELFSLQAGANTLLQPVERLARFIEQVRARMGNASLQQLRCVECHAPERAQSTRRVDHETLQAATVTEAIPTAMPIRPLWLLAHAEQLGQGRRPPPALQLLRGPERIESMSAQGERICRDYFIADERGALCWLYRDSKQGWLKHGLFG